MKGISVIMCCYNSASRLRKTLEHLAAQQLPEGFNWEIIVVDNVSKDNTKEISISIWREISRYPDILKVVDQPIQGLSFARAKGVEVSQFDFVLFCDDDNWLDTNYLSEAFAIMNSDPAIGALGGNGTAAADVPLPSWFEKYKGCYACYPQNDYDGEIERADAFLYGAGLVVRKECFVKLDAKGFVPVLPDRIGTQLTSGGDTELSYAIKLTGYKIWFSSKLKFQHYLPEARLKEEYLYRLISSMSYCSGVLMCYTYVVEGKMMNRLVWFKDAMYQILFFLKASPKYLFGERSFDNKLDFAFSYNRLRSILHQAGNYRARYNQIMKLKV
jgi:glycosyltransferase involved in cell wall biosynthesis